MSARTTQLLGLIFGIGFLAANPLSGQWTLDLETGAAFARSNDLRVPNATGTLFSLTDDLDTNPALYFRVRLGLTLGTRHHILLLAAPLTLKSSGQPDNDIHFAGQDYPAGTYLEASYTFNSWRATYRYDLVRSEKWTMQLGLTAKIRDAAITLSGDGTFSETTDFGFVPLLNFLVRWDFADRWGLLLEGDAAAAPGGQGRAEDILLAAFFRPSQRLTLRAGYRLLEGGADVDQVYSFAWLDYLSLGATITF
ncbi:MAG: hypothetical protein WBB73_03330 [Candidatus Aminicenantaceae bacterium]